MQKVFDQLCADVFIKQKFHAANETDNLRSMEKQGSGSIVNISTFAIFEPDPLFPTSGVFRAALASYTKLFSTKFAKQNVRMNNILPGFIDSLPSTEDRLARIPAGRYAEVRELSEAVAFMVSDKSSYITVHTC